MTEHDARRLTKGTPVVWRGHGAVVLQKGRVQAVDADSVQIYWGQTRRLGRFRFAEMGEIWPYDLVIEPTGRDSETPMARARRQLDPGRKWAARRQRWRAERGGAG